MAHHIAIISLHALGAMGNERSRAASVTCWNGKDKEGDAIISLTILAVRKDKALLLTYWASPEGTKSHAKELGEIMSSVKGIM